MKIKPISKFLLRQKTPMHVSYFCTFRCNLKCRYCGIHQTKRKEMNTDQSKQAIRELADAGCMWWDFTGGEPLMRKDIGILVDYAKDFGLVVDIGTNGILLKKKIDEIKKLDYLVISLDGPRDINDKMRGNGTFDKTIEGLKLAVSNSFEVIINAVVSDANLEDDMRGIKYLIDLSEDMGCKLSFSKMYADAFNKDEIKRVLPKESIESMKILLKGKKNIVSLNGFIESLSNSKINCKAGKYFCEIMPDGIVVPCLLKQEQGISGTDIGFDKAFFSLKTDEYCECDNTCYAQMNSLLSLKPRTLFEVFLNYKRVWLN